MAVKNKIIDAYVNSTELFESIFESLCDKKQFLEFVLLQINKEGKKPSVNHQLLDQIDQAIITGHEDLNVYLLFIGRVFVYYHRFNQLEKAKALISIMSSFPFNDIHPFIRAIYIQQKARIYRKTGQENEYMKMMEESIRLVNVDHPKYFVLYFNYLFIYASQGKLKEGGEFKKCEFDWPINTEKFLRMLQLKIANSLRIGDYKEGMLYLEEFKSKSIEGLPHFLDDFENTLKLLSGDFNEKLYMDDSFKNIANAFQCLATNRFDEAKVFLDQFLKQEHINSYLDIFSEYIELNINLVLRKIGPVKLYLSEKIKNGNFHYIDDLFLGRLYLLENETKKADGSFNRLISNINRYGAKMRLEFELQFAKEMKLKDILKLLNGWETTNEPIAQNNFEFANKVINIKNDLNYLVGKSPKINNIKSLIKKYANIQAPILVTGETGTGKELVSRAIHEEGPQSNEQFIAINCGALTDTLLQSELFGYEAGAFTGAQKQKKGIFESAGKGTVFLDEFGDISPNLQVSLLRVLESNEIRLIGSSKTRKIECKVVIATNVNLRNAVIEKKFREDLYFRISRFEIELPALRERKEDLPDLIQHFIDINNVNMESPKSISNELLETLCTYHWPGNIRELKNEIDRLFILNPDKKLFEKQDFDLSHLQKQKSEKTEITADIKNNDNMKVELKADPYDNIIQNAFHMERRHKFIKELFAKYKRLTRKQIIEITKVGPTTISKDLQILIDEGFILRQEPKSSPRTHYFEYNINKN